MSVTVNLFYGHWHVVLTRLNVKIANAFGMVPGNFSDLWIRTKKCYNLQHLSLLCSSTFSSGVRTKSLSLTLNVPVLKNRTSFSSAV